ncbi:uncharacterized protein K02A2.6-like [Crassostrea angulata]|uniref:uncharacterized protein K02A2.6-like n=1 Tax=Magallana angulata TaxID=2784310 RepID=UPI0022B0C92F|nr:uncharacterized protein K02A2.6-like [Crassostrea angulata]
MTNLADIKKKFKECFNPRENVTYERHGLIRELRRKGNLSTLLSQNFDKRAAEVSETQLREMGDEKNVHAVKDKKQNYKQRVAKLEPIVDDDVQPILGLKSSLDMNLVNRVYTVNRLQCTESVEGLFNEYDHLFHGIGCLSGKYDIKVDHRAKPVVATPRRIPHTLKDKVREELQRMESMKIISKVETPTRWVSPIVVVKKPSGKVRICLDPRELNKAILREHYPLKTVEEVAASLKQAKHFTTMDAAS